MRFDDRLKTVLALRPQHAHDRAVRWRQLVELLARGGGEQTSLVARAFGEVRRESGAVDEQLRAATARAIANPQLPAELVALFAADSIAVAAPVLAAANLSPDEWRLVFDRASPNSRRFLHSLHPELVAEQQEPERQPEAEAGPEPEPAAPPPRLEPTAPPPEPEPEAPAPEPEPEPEPEAEANIPAPEAGIPAPEARAEVPSISEVIARIERLRQEREQLSGTAAPPPLRPPPPPPQPVQPAGEPSLFRWECGPSGEIAWVEGVPRGALIGRSLANPGEPAGVDESIQRAFEVRAPFREASLSIAGEGTAAGEWKLSGVPAFEPSDGRFAGYRGVGVRGEASAPEAAVEPRRAPGFDDNSIRELVHELKTPLNAIIGFAEIIDGQYLGPADHGYRERAAEIVAQARLLLSAIEDLDLAARLRSAPEQAGGSTDLRELVAQASAELVEQAGRRGASLLLELPAKAVRCALEQSLAARIVRRFCTSIIDSATSGERLRLALTGEVQRCLLALDKPEALRSLEGQGDQPVALLSTGVSLRLVRALARVAGGDLLDSAESATLALPRAD